MQNQSYNGTARQKPPRMHVARSKTYAGVSQDILSISSQTLNILYDVTTTDEKIKKTILEVVNIFSTLIKEIDFSVFGIKNNTKEENLDELAKLKMAKQLNIVAFSDSPFWSELRDSTLPESSRKLLRNTDRLSVEIIELIEDAYDFAYKHPDRKRKEIANELNYIRKNLNNISEALSKTSMSITYQMGGNGESEEPEN
jgi:hypothetical protein